MIILPLPFLPFVYFLSNPLSVYISLEYPSIYLTGDDIRRSSRPATRPCTFVINRSLFLTLQKFLLLKWTFFSFFMKTTHNLSINPSRRAFLHVYLFIDQSYKPYKHILTCKQRCIWGGKKMNFKFDIHPCMYRTLRM